MVRVGVGCGGGWRVLLLGWCGVGRVVWWLGLFVWSDVECLLLCGSDDRHRPCEVHHALLSVWHLWRLCDHVQSPAAHGELLLPLLLLLGLLPQPVQLQLVLQHLLHSDVIQVLSGVVVAALLLWPAAREKLVSLAVDLVSGGVPHGGGREGKELAIARGGTGSGTDSVSVDVWEGG